MDTLLDNKTNVGVTHKNLQSTGTVLHINSHSCHHHNTSPQLPSNCHHSNKESQADVSKVSRRPRKSPYPMISVEEAQKIVLLHAERNCKEYVSLEDSLGQ